jgi:hypothetical protein
MGKGLGVEAKGIRQITCLFSIDHRSSCVAEKGRRSTNWLKLVFARQAASGSFALFKFFQHAAKIFGREIRPSLGKEAQFGEGAFPQQKIGEALFAAGANQEIDVSGAAALDFGEDVAECFAGEAGDFVKLGGGLEDGVARGIINGQAEMEFPAVGGEGFRIGNGFAKIRGKAVAASDDSQANSFIEAVGGFGQKIFLENLENRGDFSGGPRPVGRR